jgi:MFS family permease
VKIAAYQTNEAVDRFSPTTDSYSSSRLSSLMWEGAYANVFIVLTGGAFLTGLALLLGANDFEIGALAATPFLMQSIQLISPYLFRDPVVCKQRIAVTIAISRLLWLIVIPLVLLSGPWRLPVLIGIVLLSGLLTMVSSPAWLSWMADNVPKSLRGRFFSQRNAAVAATTVAGTILGSLILDWSRGRGAEPSGFSTIVLLAVVGALLAWRAMSRIPNTHRTISITDRPKPDLFVPFHDRIFRQVLIVFAVWNIAIGLSAAFFAPHMLLNLKMSFFQIGLYTCATALVAVVSSRFWGGFIDRFNSKPVLNVCAFGIAFIPIIWLFPQKDSLWILAPEAIYSGLLWAGFNLAAFTLPLDRSPKVDRTIYLSVFAAVTGLAFFTASIVAGYVAEFLSGWSYALAGLTILNYHVLFVGSALLRLLTAGLVVSFHEPAEMRLPVVIQLMGYAVLKHISIGRQLFPFAAEASTSDNKPRNQVS